MKSGSASQPNLFEQIGARRLPMPRQKEQLAMLIGTLLLEIVAATASEEISNEQNYR